jgi:hypothetical protein
MIDEIGKCKTKRQIGRLITGDAVTAAESETRVQ